VSTNGWTFRRPTDVEAPDLRPIRLPAVQCGSRRWDVKGYNTNYPNGADGPTAVEAVVH